MGHPPAEMLLDSKRLPHTEVTLHTESHSPPWVRTTLLSPQGPPSVCRRGPTPKLLPNVQENTARDREAVCGGGGSDAPTFLRDPDQPCPVGLSAIHKCLCSAPQGGQQLSGVGLGLERLRSRLFHSSSFKFGPQVCKGLLHWAVLPLTRPAQQGQCLPLSQTETATYSHHPPPRKTAAQMPRCTQHQAMDTRATRLPRTSRWGARQEPPSGPVWCPARLPGVGFVANGL